MDQPNLRKYVAGLTLTAAASAVLLASVTTAQAQGKKSPYAMAGDWVNGKLTNYGPAKVTYSGPPIKLRMTMHTPAVSGLTKFAVKSNKILEKMSQGKLTVNLRAAGVVHNVKEGFKANRSGLTDMSPCFTFLNPTNFPLTKTLGLPGLFSNAAEMSLVTEKLYAKYFAKEFERQGVFALGFIGSAQFRLFSKKPITSLEDLKGMKVRSGGGISQQIFNSLGSATVMMSSANFYSGLQRGLIDAIFTSDMAGMIFRINEVATHHTDTFINHTQLDWCINRKTYTKLPGDLKIVLNNWARANFQSQTQNVFLRVSGIARKKFKKQGIQFHSLSATETKRWQAAYAKVNASFIKESEAKGLPVKQLIADIKSEVAKLNGKSYNELMAMTINTPIQNFWPK